MSNKLATFVFIQGDKIISPYLTTVREYARWLEATFNEYTCNYELYLKATIDGNKVLEFHPGTRIGRYFDNGTWDARYISWYVQQNSAMMKKLNKMKFAEYKDIAPIMAGDKKGMRLLRLYSVDQINLYVKTAIDRNFHIVSYLTQPKKIVLRKCDMDQIIIPKTKSVKKSLLDTESKVTMTIKEIENLLGHKVSIISE